MGDIITGINNVINDGTGATAPTNGTGTNTAVPTDPVSTTGTSNNASM